MTLENHLRNEHIEEVFCNPEGDIDFRMPIETALDKPVFQATFKVTGYLMFGDVDLRPVDDTYHFVSAELEAVPQAALLERIQGMYGLDSDSIGSITEFQCIQLE